MSVVVGMDDPNYGESKAMELIAEAKIIAKQFYPGSRYSLIEQYQEKLSQAMALLALCKVQRNGAAEDTKA